MLCIIFCTSLQFTIYRALYTKFSLFRMVVALSLLSLLHLHKYIHGIYGLYEKKIGLHFDTHGVANAHHLDMYTGSDGDMVFFLGISFSRVFSSRILGMTSRQLIVLDSHNENLVSVLIAKNVLVWYLSSCVAP